MLKHERSVSESRNNKLVVHLKENISTYQISKDRGHYQRSCQYSKPALGHPHACELQNGRQSTIFEGHATTVANFFKKKTQYELQRMRLFIHTSRSAFCHVRRWFLVSTGTCSSSSMTSSPSSFSNSTSALGSKFKSSGSFSSRYFKKSGSCFDSS